jgi:hypothetical protein
MKLPCSLVKDENGRIFQKSPGDGDALFLSARYGHSSFADDCLVAPREVADEFIRISQFGSFCNLLKKMNEFSLKTRPIPVRRMN